MNARPVIEGPSALSSSLPHQLSQLCGGQQHPLLALQNFSHLLPPNYASHPHFNCPSNSAQLGESLSRGYLYRTPTNNNHSHHHHHHHHHHHNREHNPSHHARSHHNWRKSKPQLFSKMPNGTNNNMLASQGSPHSLLDLSAKVVAEHIPFQAIEQRYEHIPEPVQRRIIFWSFPRYEDDIKMYSSLSSDSSNSTAATSTSTSNSAVSQLPSTNSNAWAEQQPTQPNAAASSSSSSSSSSTHHNKSNHHNKQITFNKGLRLYNEGCIQDVLQVGFSLSGSITVKVVNPNQSQSSSSRVRGLTNHQMANNVNEALIQASSSHNSDLINSSSESLLKKTYRVSVTFDRCKITSVSCSCEIQDIFWCEHVVALILYRIRNPETIDLRVPISETLLTLDRQQLQKLVQYIIAEHHTEVLPTAQRLLDEMRQSLSEINQIQGAPDPTAGASASDEHIWHLDEQQVNEKVQNYLNSVYSNSKDAVKQIHALFEKIREMFRAKDSNGIRLLRLITEQFLLYATKNEKSRPLWDQLISLWVVVMLNPDLSSSDRLHFVRILTNWSKVAKCPKEDVDRRPTLKRKATDLSDDEDNDDHTANLTSAGYAYPFNQSNNYPAHMATHRRPMNLNGLPVLRQYNQIPVPSSSCPCQLQTSMAKKMRSSMYNSPSSSSASTSKSCKAPNPSSYQSGPSRNLAHPSESNENIPVGSQEPRSVFYRALEFQDFSWDDPHLQLILNKEGPVDLEPVKKNQVDFAGNPLWTEPISQAAARIETLRSYGYREQALRLTVAVVRRLKVHQDQWCLAISPEPASDHHILAKDLDIYDEGWIGHPFDPINVMVDVLLEASLNDVNNNIICNPNGPAATSSSVGLCQMDTSRCAYNQALTDFRLSLDWASLSYPILPLADLTSKRTTMPVSQSSNKTPYYHVPVPGCCQKDSYLSLGVELALIALGQQRTIPNNPTAHDRAVRQESELITKLELIDTSELILNDILKHQATVLLEGGPFQNSCCGVPYDAAPLHTFARYLFESLVSRCPQLAYKVGVYALKMPLMTDESENLGSARASPRSINYSHLQSEQLALAQTMLSRAKDEVQPGGFLKKVYRASVKNIRSASSLLKLSKHLLKEAKPNGTTLYPALLKTSFDLGLQVLRMTMAPHSSVSKVRREAIVFIVECATDIGLESVLQIMKEARDHFSAAEALNLVVSRDNDHVNLRSQAYTKLKLKDSTIREMELNRRSRDLALDCATRDPSNCALEALRFCEADDDATNKALKIVLEAGSNGAMDSTQLIKVADHIHERGMTEKAFDIAMVAVNSLSIPSNSENSSTKKDIFSACEYAQKVNGFSTLIPKLIDNIECATVLSEIYHRFSPSSMAPAYRNYPSNFIASYRGGLMHNKGYNDILNSLNPQIYKQKFEDTRCWDDLLKRTMETFVSTTRSRLQNISPRHYGEFVEFLVKAQQIFDKAPDGPQQFKDLVAEIIKSYKTKKKLMERLRDRFDPPLISSKI